MTTSGSFIKCKIIYYHHQCLYWISLLQCKTETPIGFLRWTPVSQNKIKEIKIIVYCINFYIFRGSSKFTLSFRRTVSWRHSRRDLLKNWNGATGIFRFGFAPRPIWSMVQDSEMEEFNNFFYPCGWQFLLLLFIFSKH